MDLNSEPRAPIVGVRGEEVSCGPTCGGFEPPARVSVVSGVRASAVTSSGARPPVLHSARSLGGREIAAVVGFG